MPTPTKVALAETEPEQQQQKSVIPKRTYKITRGVWSVVDDETGERLTYVAGELIELTPEEYERNKRNVIAV